MKRVIVDERRHVFVAKTEDEAYEFCLQSITEEIKKAISARASCSLALSGGTTPIRLFDLLIEPSSALPINWSLLDIFWCDERCVPPDHSESNYGAAMHYFSSSPLDQAKLHRLAGEAVDREATTREYEQLVTGTCSGGRFDVVLLGIGEDGHTASLFPNTAALKEEHRLYVPNFVPQKDSWRLTMTFPAIERARTVYVLALGKTKSKALKQIFFGEYNYEQTPAQKLGTKTNPVCYIIDKKAAYGLGLKT
jgi:6-phosphogluconolactonase